MKIQISLSQAIEGYLLDAHARQLSIKTVADYGNTFNKFRVYIGDPPLSSITTDDVRRFLADPRTGSASAGRRNGTGCWGAWALDDRKARREVAQGLGHNRVAVTCSYIPKG